jgi:hypothetical protein
VDTKAAEENVEKGQGKRGEVETRAAAGNGDKGSRERSSEQTNGARRGEDEGSGERRTQGQGREEEPRVAMRGSGKSSG